MPHQPVHLAGVELLRQLELLVEQVLGVVGGELRHDLGVGLVGGGGRHDGKVGWAELQKWLDWNRGGRRAGQGALDLCWLSSSSLAAGSPPFGGQKRSCHPLAESTVAHRAVAVLVFLCRLTFFLKKKIAYAASLAKKKAREIIFDLAGSINIIKQHLNYWHWKA